MPQSCTRAIVNWQGDRALGRVAEMLGIPPVHAYGLTVALTGYLMEHRKSGDLRQVPAAEIEAAVQWNGDPGHFAHVILNNYVDGRGVMLHWNETAFPIIKDRQANTARVAAYRQRMKEENARKADEYITGNITGGNGNGSGTGGNGAAPLNSASPSAPQIASTDRSAPGDRPRGSARSERPVMGDTPAPARPSTDVDNGYGDVDKSPSSMWESVMGDSVMGDVMRDVTPYTPPRVTHYASRAVVQDLDQKQKLDQEHSSLITDLPSPSSISVRRARAVALMQNLTAAFIVLPTAVVAGRDGQDLKGEMVAMYGVTVGAKWDAMWKTLSAFVHKFYRDQGLDRVEEVLTEMLLALSPEGILSPTGVRLANVPGPVLYSVIEETVRKPPAKLASAWPFAMRKLERGKANLELDPEGKTRTEAASERYHAQDRVIAPAVRATIDGMVGALARKTVTTKADEQRTALRWMRGSVAVRQELAEACEQNFAGWDQRLPGLDLVKENWVKAEALKRWRAAGRPLPMPPR